MIPQLKWEDGDTHNAYYALIDMTILIKCFKVPKNYIMLY